MAADMSKQYDYLWARTDPNWVLMKAPSLPGGYCVFNKLGSVLLIENAAINEMVCKRMRDSGCEVIGGAPSAGGIPTPEP